MASAEQPPVTRSLLALSTFYGGMICIAGVLGSKLVAVGPLGMEAGIFAFILLVATSSAVAEIAGRDAANRLVATGFVPLIASMLLVRLVLVLPPANFWGADKQAAFDMTLNQTSRMMLAGMIAYGCSQTLNVFVFTRLKAGTKLLWLRAMIAGVLSQAVDTVVFITIAFVGASPVLLILPGQLLAKVIFSAVLSPALVYGMVAVARRLDRPASARPGERVI